MYNYLRIKLASTDLVPVESGYFDNEFFPDSDKDDYVASVRDYRPYEDAAIKNKDLAEKDYGLFGGSVGGTLGALGGWHGSDYLLRNADISDRSKNIIKALGATGTAIAGGYIGDRIGRNLAPVEVVKGEPTIPVTLTKKNKPVIPKIIDTNFV